MTPRIIAYNKFRDETGHLISALNKTHEQSKFRKQSVMEKAARNYIFDVGHNSF